MGLGATSLHARQGGHRSAQGRKMLRTQLAVSCGGPMSNPVSNDELDWLIWRALRDRSDRDGHPTNDSDLVAAAGGNWRRIDSRIQAMRKTGRIQFWRHPLAGQGFKPHGWEVLGCPGAGGSEDGQWHWREGCADCLRRVRPDPADGVIEPPPIIAFECELRIEPNT
jgi:hypothetical protein